MLQRNTNEGSKANASWDNYHSSNLAPLAGNVRTSFKSQNEPPSKFSNMTRNISFEKFSQVFSAKNANSSNNIIKTTNKRRSSLTSQFDLNQNKRGAAEATTHLSSNSTGAQPINNTSLDQLPAHGAVQQSLTMQQLQLLQQVQQTLQQQNAGKIENSAGIVPSVGDEDTVGNLPGNFPSLRRFKSCNVIPRGQQLRGSGPNVNGDHQNHFMAASSHKLSSSQQPSLNNNKSMGSFALSGSQRSGGSGNQEWGCTIPSAAQPPAVNSLQAATQSAKDIPASSSGSDNMFQSMISNDTEMKDLLQTLRTEEGPVKQSGNFVNDFIQPHDLELKSRNTKRNTRASVSCCMNEYSLRKTPSHSTLRPSRSILLESRYSNTSMVSLASHTGSGERLMRRSSSNVKFSAPTVHTISGEVDKTMWYTKEEEKKMIVDMIRSKKRKEAKRKAKLMKGRSEVSPSVSPASSVRSLQADSPPKSPEEPNLIESNDQPGDNIPPSEIKQNLNAKDLAPRIELIPTPTVNLSIAPNVTNASKDREAKVVGIEKAKDINKNSVGDDDDGPEDHEYTKGELICGWD